MLRLSYKVIYAVLVGEHAVPLVVLEHTKVRLSRHQKPVMLHYINKTKTQEIEGDVHEVGRTIRHQSNDVAISPYDLGIHGCSDVLFDLSHSLRLFHVESLAFKDHIFREGVGHQLFELQEHLEQLSSKDGKILFFEELRVDLRKRVELGVDLVLGD